MNNNHHLEHRACAWNCIIAVALSLAALVCDLRAESDVVEIRQCICACITNDLDEVTGDARQIANIGFLNWQTPSHSNLVTVVSNRFEVAFSNFVGCASNQTERYVLLSAGWTECEDYYLRFADSAANLALSGTIRKDEFEWFLLSDHDDRVGSCLERRFAEPAVSNIINKIECITAWTNYCNKVRTGAAWTEWQSFIGDAPYGEHE